MIFTPQTYAIPDRPHEPFLDPSELERILSVNQAPSLELIRTIIAKSLSKKRLTLAETAALINASSPEAIEAILEGARRLKQAVYGNRIVLFAPLYVGNRCINNCDYCGFRAGNRQALRRTLTDAEIIQETEALEENGHKRLILVYGEHPVYNAEYIAHTVRLVYGVKKKSGSIRRVNINAAPLGIEDFRVVKAAGIGTYQIFQETYHPEAYARHHPAGPKSDYNYRLTSLDRAMEAGIDDVGIGALLGLYDWRFEILGLVRHANHLEACFHVGPHTISFPRIKDASESHTSLHYGVSDDDFIRLVAILRLAVPYTGLILTAREPAPLRDRLIEYGVSQIDGGTRLELGGYSRSSNDQDLNREQFKLNDDRSLSEIIAALTAQGRIPSFCTACYRKGRTGEHFMEFSVNGFIKRFCTPNALLTFAEYLEDYASGEIYTQGWSLIESELASTNSEELRQRIDRLRSGQRDLLF